MATPRRWLSVPEIFQPFSLSLLSANWPNLLASNLNSQNMENSISQVLPCHQSWSRWRAWEPGYLPWRPDSSRAWGWVWPLRRQSREKMHLQNLSVPWRLAYLSKQKCISSVDQSGLLPPPLIGQVEPVHLCDYFSQFFHPLIDSLFSNMLIYSPRYIQVVLA